MDFDIDDLKHSAVKRMLKHALLKGHKSDEKKKASDDEADKEQEDLADLHREGKGDSNAPKVENDDLPVEVRKVALDDGDGDEPEQDTKESEKHESPLKKGKKQSPFKKHAKHSFPFKKKG